jgi:hypothetical protein
MAAGVLKSGPDESVARNVAIGTDCEVDVAGRARLFSVQLDRYATDERVRDALALEELRDQPQRPLFRVTHWHTHGLSPKFVEGIAVA